MRPFFRPLRPRPGPPPRAGAGLPGRVAALALACAAALPAAARPPEGLASAPAPAPAAVQHAVLPAAVDAALVRARVPREALSALVADAGGRAAPRLAWRTEAPVNPASVMKVVTTYAGLDLLGPAYTWSTPVYADGPIAPDGTLRGNLYLRGQGDPKLVVERLWLLLQKLQGLGVRRIAGDIVLDRSAFSLPPHDPAAFDGESWRPYNAAPDALLVNFRAVTMTFVPDPAAGVARVAYEPALAGLQLQASVPLSAEAACDDWRAPLLTRLADPARIAFDGRYPAVCGERSWTVAYADPATHAARAVESVWLGLGGRLAGRVRNGMVPAGLAPLFAFSSPPLAEVVRDINKFSNNVMAQQLFLTLSREAHGVGSFEGSREVLSQWWTMRFGPADLPQLYNGAGLSRTGRITVRGMGRMLQAAWASPLMADLAASLPIYGIDGTLRRATGAPAGSAHLKTGSLRDVGAMAGYVDGASGQRWVLVATINHPNAAAARPALDALVDWAARDLSAPRVPQ
ncbi:MAG: D-alanyl-D-alanine carboxypeptidase/D-alanyl-D-alanine-endopeptidase [Xylophilus ampelinus]